MLPNGLPKGSFDLVVVSEIAYYLSPRDLETLARRLRRALAPGGLIVVLHHVVPFDDTAQPPALAQHRLCRLLAKTLGRASTERHGRYSLATFRQPSGKRTSPKRRSDGRPAKRR